MCVCAGIWLEAEGKARGARVEGEGARGVRGGGKEGECRNDRPMTGFGRPIGRRNCFFVKVMACFMVIVCVSNRLRRTLLNPVS